MYAALVLATVAQAVPPPPGLGEPYAPGPYIVFFADGRDRPWGEGRAILARIRADRRILSGAQLRLCSPAADRRLVARRRAIVRAVRVAGVPTLALLREGRGCSIAGGSRRAPGLIAYQLEFGPAG